jgi:hypothetical protein
MVASDTSKTVLAKAWSILWHDKVYAFCLTLIFFIISILVGIYFSRDQATRSDVAAVGSRVGYLVYCDQHPSKCAVPGPVPPTEGKTAKVQPATAPVLSAPQSQATSLSANPVQTLTESRPISSKAEVESVPALAVGENELSPTAPSAKIYITTAGEDESANDNVRSAVAADSYKIAQYFPDARARLKLELIVGYENDGTSKPKVGVEVTAHWATGSGPAIAPFSAHGLNSYDAGKDIVEHLEKIL